MQTAQLVDMSPVSFSAPALKGLQQLAKALPKSSPRNYATVIGIRDGFACVTDGFSLVQWSPADGSLAGFDLSIKGDFNTSAVKFPQWRGVVSSDPAQAVNADQLQGLLAHYKPVRASHCVKLAFDPAGYGKDGKAIETGLVPSLHFNPNRDSFNPDLIVNALKAIPKESKLEMACIRGEQLHIHFTGGWLILVVCVAVAKQE